jgi:type IV pilus assembly protein PilP
VKINIKKKVLTTITAGFCFLFSFLWISGCDLKAGTPQKSTVVTQKIVPSKAKAVGGEPSAQIRETTSSAKPAGSVRIKKAKQAPGMISKKPEAPSMVALINLFKKEKPTSHKALYDPKGKIDPFKPLFGEVQKVKIKIKKRRHPLTPLEKVDLSQLKLVAVILASSGNRALVKEASGKSYVIKKDTLIGLHSGRVIQILKNRVIVKEEIEDYRGKVSTRHNEMKLQKPPGE